MKSVWIMYRCIEKFVPRRSKGSSGLLLSQKVTAWSISQSSCLCHVLVAPLLPVFQTLENSQVNVLMQEFCIAGIQQYLRVLSRSCNIEKCLIKHQTSRTSPRPQICCQIISDLSLYYQDTTMTERALKLNHIDTEYPLYLHDQTGQRHARS